MPQQTGSSWSKPISRRRALALGGTQRFPTLPEVPTLAEAGLPNYNFQSWFGIQIGRAHV